MVLGLFEPGDVPDLESASSRILCKEAESVAEAEKTVEAEEVSMTSGMVKPSTMALYTSRRINSIYNK